MARRHRHGHLQPTHHNRLGRAGDFFARPVRRTGLPPARNCQRADRARRRVRGKLGSPIVELTVRADNPAQMFYQRSGFQPLPHCLTYVLAGPGARRARRARQRKQRNARPRRLGRVLIKRAAVFCPLSLPRYHLHDWRVCLGRGTELCTAANRTLFDHIGGGGECGGGILKPSALAVFRFITDLYLVGACTGRPST